MSQTTNTENPETTTNPTIVELATERSALPLRQLHLIGVVGPPDARRALLRTPGGQIQTVSVGDSLRRGRVVAIDEEAVILSTPKGSETLLMPETDAPHVAA